MPTLALPTAVACDPSQACRVLTRATQLAPHHTARARIWLLWGFLLIALYGVSAAHLLEAHGSGSGGALCVAGQQTCLSQRGMVVL